MSTADCKDLLVEAYPNTCAKAWKRAAKFKNIHNEDIRLFTHPEIGRVWVDEEEGGLSTEPADIRNVQASSLTASDFYVAFESSIENGIVMCSSVMVVYAPYFEEHGCFDSVHLGPVVLGFFPKGLGFGEDAEASFSIPQDIPLDELKGMFRSAGFLESEAAQRLFE